MFEEMDKIVNKFINNDPKKVSSMDEGFIESCIDLGEFALARQFLMDIYKYTLEEALTKILVKVKEMREHK